MDKPLPHWRYMSFTFTIMLKRRPPFPKTMRKHLLVVTIMHIFKFNFTMKEMLDSRRYSIATWHNLFDGMFYIKHYDSWLRISIFIPSKNYLVSQYALHIDVALLEWDVLILLGYYNISEERPEANASVTMHCDAILPMQAIIHGGFPFCLMNYCYS